MFRIERQNPETLEWDFDSEYSKTYIDLTEARDLVKELKKFQPKVTRQVVRICEFETTDGNEDDPMYYYCGKVYGHAGKHGEWTA